MIGNISFFAYHKIHLATLVTVLFVLFIPCAVLIVILQMKNKQKRRRQRLSESKTVAVSRLFSTRRPTQQQAIDRSVTTLIKNQQIYSTFLTGATLNLILYCPLLLFLLSHLICFLFRTQQQQCNDFIWAAAYFEKIIFLHALVDSIAYFYGMDKAHELKID